MSTQLKLRRGTTAEHATFTGAEGEVTVDTTRDSLVVHDGVTIGGHAIAKKSEVDAKQDILTIDATPTDGSSNAVSSNGVFDALALKAPLASPSFTGTPSFVSSILFEGSTADAYETTITVTNPTADRTITIPNATGTIVLTSGTTMTGAITALRETKVAMGANDIDLSAGNLFTKTISGATTLTVSNWLASGNANSFILELTNGGSAVITWFSGVKWAGGTAPTLTASGVDILGFYSHDGGTTVRGIVLAKDSK